MNTIPPPNPRWPLAVKLTLAMVLLLMAGVTGVTYLWISRVERAFRVELEQQAELLIRSLAASATYPFYNLDTDFLSDMASVIAKDRLVVSARIYDVKGRVIADAHDPDMAISTPQDPFGESLVAIDTAILEWQPDQLLAGRVVLAGDRRMGAVSVGLSRAPLDAKVAALRAEGFAAGMAASAGGVILALIVSRSITRPLQQLTQATERVAAGDLTQRIAVRTSDEVAILAAGFNSMVAQLRGIMDDLERRIHERTQRLSDRERQLSEVKVFLEQLIAASPMVFFRADTRDYTVSYISANVTRLVGFAPEEVLGVPRFWLEHTHPDDRKRLRDELSQMHASAGTAAQIEHRLLHKDGSSRSVLSVMRLERVEADQPLSVFGYALDITERKRAEEALQASEEAFRAASEAASEAIVSADIRGVIIYFNKAAERIFDYAASEMIGKPFTSLMPERLRTRYRRTMKQVLATGQANFIGRATEHVGRRSDGSEFSIEVSLARWRTAQGTFFTATIRDITERKQAEQIVYAAKEEAERANRAKSEFLSRMSHELRTPLNAILGFAQLLEMEDLNQEQRESVGHILRGGQHLLELVNEVLDITRIETGRLAVSPEPVSLRYITQLALHLVAPLAAESRVRLDGNLGTISDIYLLADQQRLKQVLLNLIANAVKYNRPGGSVVLTYEERDDVVQINVTDTGPGIAPEKLERLFTPFERLDAEQSGVEGTGLGLALSKHLVELMGGRLGVQSTVGVGSTFWVELSRAAGPAERWVEAGQADQTTPSPAHATHDRLRPVLYIEEGLTNLSLIQSLLARRPHVRLLTAPEGRGGLALAREQLPHVILLDAHGPDMGAEDVLAELQSTPETRQIPVVVIGSDKARGQIERLRALGVQGYLSRPIDVKQFMQVLDDALGEPAENGRTAAIHVDPSGISS